MPGFVRGRVGLVEGMERGFLIVARRRDGGCSAARRFARAQTLALSAQGHHRANPRECAILPAQRSKASRCSLSSDGQRRGSGYPVRPMFTRRVTAFVLGLVLSAGLAACGPTPTPSASAEDAAAAGVPLRLAAKLERRHPLTPDELVELMGAKGGEKGLHDPALLALLAQNPGVPASMLETMARHPSDVVRMGVAANPATPGLVLERLRGVGPGHLINRSLATNPSMPIAVVLEMRAKGEIGDAALAGHPSLPQEKMLALAQNGSETERVALAANPALAPNIVALLRVDSSDDVKAAIEKHHPKKSR